MDLIYNADSEKVIDGDIIPLNTVKDLEKEIGRTQDEIDDMKGDLEKGTISIPTEIFLKRRIKQFEIILKSLLDLKKSGFGKDSVDQDVKLNTEEDLDREIQKTTQAVTEIQETVKSQRKTVKLLKAAIGGPIEKGVFIGGHPKGDPESLRDMEKTLRINIKWLKDHERILESLFTLKRSRFG